MEKKTKNIVESFVRFLRSVSVSAESTISSAFKFIHFSSFSFYSCSLSWIVRSIRIPDFLRCQHIAVHFQWTELWLCRCHCHIVIKLLIFEMGSRFLRVIYLFIKSHYIHGRRIKVTIVWWSRVMSRQYNWRGTICIHSPKSCAQSFSCDWKIKLNI